MKKLISNSLIFLIIIFLINICYSKFILKDNLIKIFGKSIVVVTTGSMEPEINAGDLLIISESKNYKIGDIVTYQDNEGFLVTHRIIQINQDTFISKGDSNNLSDEENLNNNIKGKVIYHSKVLGFFVLYLLKPIVVIYVILFVIVNLYFIIIKRNKNFEEKIKLEDEIKKEEMIDEKI